MICKLYSILKIVYLYTILLVKLTLWPTMCYEAFLFSPSGLSNTTSHTMGDHHKGI